MFNSQKKYFKKKLAGIQATIWDFEFKKFKNRLIREEFRKEYDGLKSKLHILLPRLESEKDKLPVDEFKRLEDQKVILERDIKRQEEKMAELDVEVFGANASDENPDGLAGINHQIDALVDLKSICKGYIKQL